MKLLRWGVKIDSAVGDPFLKAWKQYLASSIRDQVSEPTGKAPAPKRLKVEERPKPPPKRVKKSAKAPPIHTLQARVQRMVAAREAVAAQSPVVPEFSEQNGSSSTSTVGVARWGRAAQGPPT